MSKHSERLSVLLEAHSWIQEALEQAVAGNQGPRRVPVVVMNTLHNSITDAAYWLCQNHLTMYNYVSGYGYDPYRFMRNMIQLVRRNCTAYSGVWFLAEDGDPSTWNVKPGEYEDFGIKFQDLRRKK